MIRTVKKTLGFRVAPDLKQVVYLQIKDLNYEAKDKLKDTLEKLKLNHKSTDALLVGINVGPATDRQKDQLAYADLMAKMLQRKAKELEVPLVTYAEEQSLMHGMHLLVHGDHVLANECSILGNIGSSLYTYYMKDFIEDWHLRMRYVHHGQNKVRFNQFEPLKQADIDWMQDIYRQRITYIVDNMMDCRKDKVTDPTGTRKLLEEGNFMFGPKALSLGLIDRVTTPDEFFTEHFGGQGYTIGEPKIPFLAKLGIKGFGKSTLLDFDEQLITDEMAML